MSSVAWGLNNATENSSKTQHLTNPWKAMGKICEATLTAMTKYLARITSRKEGFTLRACCPSVWEMHGPKSLVAMDIGSAVRKKTNDRTRAQVIKLKSCSQQPTSSWEPLLPQTSRAFQNSACSWRKNVYRGDFTFKATHTHRTPTWKVADAVRQNR